MKVRKGIAGICLLLADGLEAIAGLLFPAHEPQPRSASVKLNGSTPEPEHVVGRVADALRRQHEG